MPENNIADYFYNNDYFIDVYEPMFDPLKINPTLDNIAIQYNDWIENWSTNEPEYHLLEFFEMTDMFLDAMLLLN